MLGGAELGQLDLEGKQQENHRTPEFRFLRFHTFDGVEVEMAAVGSSGTRGGLGLEVMARLVI